MRVVIFGGTGMVGQGVLRECLLAPDVTEVVSVSRRPLTAWRPWLFVFAVILWNEAVDLWVERWSDPGQQYGEGLKDLLLTMATPTVVMAAARLRPQLFDKSAA